MAGSVATAEKSIIDDGTNLTEPNVTDVIKHEAHISEELSGHTIETINEFRKNKKLCDFQIVLDNGSTFDVHKIILCTVSEYFKIMSTTSLPTSRNQSILHIPGFGADVMESIIDYAYTRALNLTNDNVIKILTAANYFLMSKVEFKCIEFIKTILTTKNCFAMLSYAKQYMLKDLEDDMRKYILKNINEISKESIEMLLIPFEEFKDILSSDRLNVKKEEMVWELIVKWIDIDPGNREKYIGALLETIRLGLLDSEYFNETVCKHKYIENKEECLPLITKTLTFFDDLDTIATKDNVFETPPIAFPRTPHEIIIAIGGWSGGSPTNVIETYDTRADRWIILEQSNPIGARAYHGTEVIDGQIFIMGGFDGAEYFNSCLCFNTVSKEWNEIAPMHKTRCYISTAKVGDYIYAMGGYNGVQRQCSVERYNYKTNQWTMITPMHYERSDACATTLNGKIYITGGFNGSRCLDSCEVYDPETETWTMIEPMQYRRSGVACIAHHGYIYVIGGFTGLSRLANGEKYDPINGTWTLISEMDSQRSNFSLSVLDDMIFAIGGYNGVTTITHVECYEESSNLWYEATEMNVNRSAVSACVISDIPNILNYTYKNRTMLMEEKRQRVLSDIAARLNTNNVLITNSQRDNSLVEMRQRSHFIDRILQDLQ